MTPPRLSKHIATGVPGGHRRNPALVPTPMPGGWKELLGLAGWRSVLRDDVLVKLQVLRHDLVFAELLAHDDGSRASDPFVQRAVREQLDAAIGHRFHIILVTQKPRLAVI